MFWLVPCLKGSLYWQILKLERQAVSYCLCTFPLVLKNWCAWLCQGMSPVEGSDRHLCYDLCKVGCEAFVDVCYFHSFSSNLLLNLSKSSINWMAQWAQCYKCCGLAAGDSMLHADRFHMILIVAVAIGSRVLVVVFHAIPMTCFSGCSCPSGTAFKVWIQRSTENCIQGR